MRRTVRAKWQFEENDLLEPPRSTLDDKHDMDADRATIERLLRGDSLTTHFQPIFHARDGGIFGHEALTRLNGENPFPSICDLFNRAILTGTIAELDVICLETALGRARECGIDRNTGNLFINICPETLMNPDVTFKAVENLMDRLGIPHGRIVLEITEESVISNYSFFRQSLDIYRNKGFKIAIDDFGAGYGGLKMLSTIEPDFVKIDRHFIANIDRAIVKFNLVDAIATACHRIGIKVVAEGIEREEELNVVLNIGIEFLQGFFLARPLPIMAEDCPPIPIAPALRHEALVATGEYCFIGDIARPIPPVSPNDQMAKALKRFMDNPDLVGLPVVDGDKVVGILNRSRFIEREIIGRFGYAYAMNSFKNVADVMERHLFLFEANTTFEEVSKRIQSRKAEFINEAICVLRSGRYSGMVDIALLLDAITERNIILARGSNPLSGLPGNHFIQREITKRLAQNMHFDVLYFDIDNFKPFNDHYGFEQGDTVLKSLAGIITGVLASHDANSFNFAGHIGGDDFIVITRPQISIQVAEKIIEEFERRRTDFHNAMDCAVGEYHSVDRHGESRRFGLLTLSVGIVSTEVFKVESYPQLASIASEVKKAAKRMPGSSVVRDQRMKR